MIYQPTSVQPSNVAIDAKIENTFSWVFNGDSLVKYRLDIYMLNQTEITYTNTVELSTTIYGGDTVSFSLPIDSLTNGNEYIWKLTQFEANPSMFVINGKIVEATSGTSFKISTKMSTVLAGMFININGVSKEIKTYDSSTGDITLETGFDTTPTVGAIYSIYTAFTTTLNGFYIKTRKTPVISINPLNSEELDVNGNLKYRYATFTAKYSQEQNVSIKYHHWILKENITDTIVLSTTDIYNSNLTFSYDGFASNVNYTLILNIVTQENQNVNTEYSFDVLYNQPVLFDSPVVKFNSKHNSVLIDCQVVKVSTPDVTGTYEFTDDGYLHVISGEITYNNISQKKIELDNFTILTEFYLDFTISTLTEDASFKSEGSNILNVLNSDGTSQYYTNVKSIIENNIPLGTFILQNLYNNNLLNSFKLLQLKDKVLQCLQPTNLLDTRAEYLWFEDMIFNLLDEQYFISDNTKSDKFKLAITNTQCILQNTDGKQIIIEETTNPIIFNQIKLYAGVYYNYLIVIKDTLSKNDLDIFFDNDFNPSWTTYQNTIIYAPFTDDLGSSNINSLDTYDIKSISIYRQRQNENILHKVATVTLKESYVEDFMVTNDQIYTWYIVPISNEELGAYIASNTLYIKFDEWTINPLVLENKNFYTTLETWKFGLNVEEGSLEQNILKTKFDGISKYPKYTVEQRNYISGSLTCYLGNVIINPTYNNQNLKYYSNNSIFNTNSELYYEPSSLLKQWNDLVASGTKVLIRDIKGHIYLAQIDTNNATIINYIQVSPTTISFTFTEVGNPLNLSVYTKSIDIEGVII